MAGWGYQSAASRLGAGRQGGAGERGGRLFGIRTRDLTADQVGDLAQQGQCGPAGQGTGPNLLVDELAGKKCGRDAFEPTRRIISTIR
ncbi:hypothetical protein ABIA33_006792 [Streptacidiphilus sp. MAP12-16]|uniref:hypothetical protein n=1 Tax=Streptacidiphilus sp. MAP12-16 TaxID=3156300 RepID=UPI003516318C